ncbi:hypothetical protein FOBRF1_011895 [Fusarium oxysporum]
MKLSSRWKTSPEVNDARAEDGNEEHQFALRNISRVFEEVIFRPWLGTILLYNLRQAEHVCGDAAAHVEEKKPNAARYSNIVTVANLQRGPTSLFTGPRPPSFDPPISSPLELSLILSGHRCRVAFSQSCFHHSPFSIQICSEPHFVVRPSRHMCLTPDDKLPTDSVWLECRALSSNPLVSGHQLR